MWLLNSRTFWDLYEPCKYNSAMLILATWKNSFKKFLNLHRDLDQDQNLIVCCKSHMPSLQKISLSVHKTYPVILLTDKYIKAKMQLYSPCYRQKCTQTKPTPSQNCAIRPSACLPVPDLVPKSRMNAYRNFYFRGNIPPVPFTAPTLLVGWPEGHPANWMLVCWRWHSDWSFARLTAAVVTATSIILSSNSIQNGDILVPANPGPPGKWPLKWKGTIPMLSVINNFGQKVSHSEFSNWRYYWHDVDNQ